MADASGHCDVAVIGAGPSGTIAALTAQRYGARVVLIESGGYDDLRPGETLSPVGSAVLRRLGIGADDLSPLAVPSFGNRSIWGSEEETSASFLFNPLGGGLHVDRRAFDRMLAHVAVTAGTELRLGTRVSRIARGDDGEWLLRLDGGASADTLGTRVVVVATGRRATAVRQHGAEVDRVDRLVAAIARMRLAGDAEGCTSVEAVADGWWYVAPQPGGDAIVMLMCDADICHTYGYARRDRFESALALSTLTRSRLAGTSILGGLEVRSASSHILRPAASAQGWIACGDAALAVDPLSSSGLPRAFRTGEAAGFAAVELLRGDAAPLARYVDLLKSEFGRYLDERLQNYGAERRWPNAPFWRRRHADHASGTVTAADRPEMAFGRELQRYT
jgi:flavin-dependent dehydrogenase